MKLFYKVTDAILKFYGSGKCSTCDRVVGHFGGGCKTLVDTTPVEK